MMGNCLNCGIEFQAKRKTKEFCGTTCRVTHWEKNNAGDLVGKPTTVRERHMVELVRKMTTYSFGVLHHLETIGIGKERLGELHFGRLKELTDLVMDRVVQEVSKRMEQEENLKKKAAAKKKKAVGESPNKG
jgi:hypothetical protein